MATHRQLTLEEANSLGFQDFTEHFGGVIEQTPLVAAAVWSCRPFPDLQALHTAFCQFLHSLPTEGKASVLRCHPDLAGRLAQSSALTAESTKEQSKAGMLDLSPTERGELERLNECYKEKFGVPFVICARENKKEAIFSGIRSRIGSSVAEEVETGLKEVCKIAWYRLGDLVSSCDERAQL